MEAGYPNRSPTTVWSRWTSVVSQVQKVHTITEQLLQLVAKPVVKDQRDELIDQITSLLEKREQLLPGVQAPFSEEDKLFSQQIIDWNQVITAKFTDIKQQIQLDMIQLKKSKSSNQQYINPYQSVSTSDGRFYDKRK